MEPKIERKRSRPGSSRKHVHKHCAAKEKYRQSLTESTEEAAVVTLIQRSQQGLDDGQVVQLLLNFRAFNHLLKSETAKSSSDLKITIQGICATYSCSKDAHAHLFVEIWSREDGDRGQHGEHNKVAIFHQLRACESRHGFQEKRRGARKVSNAERIEAAIHFQSISP